MPSDNVPTTEVRSLANQIWRMMSPNMLFFGTAASLPTWGHSGAVFHKRCGSIMPERRSAVP